MATYRDIENVFARFYETGAQLRQDAYNVAQMVFKALKERGQTPEGSLNLCNLDREFDARRSYTSAGATKYNPETRRWEVGFWLCVTRGKERFPRDILQFNVTLKQTEKEYTVALQNSDVTATFNPKVYPESEIVLNVFADGVFAALAKQYDASHAYWLSDDTGERVIGFQNK